MLIVQSQFMDWQGFEAEEAIYTKSNTNKTSFNPVKTQIKGSKPVDIQVSTSILSINREV